MSDATANIEHLFVYGTLRPGEERWHHLEPFVVGGGIDTATPGQLFDTGHGYPAAVFALDDLDGPPIVGRAYRLREIHRALAVLDAVESAVDGLYERVVVTVTAGLQAWAYQCGDPALLRMPITGGDWLRRHE